MDMVVRGSEYQNFLDCRKQWYYRWIEELEPKKPNNVLFTGTAFHKWLENYYNNACSKSAADYLTTIWMNEQDMGGMEQTEIDEMIQLLRGMAAHYDETYYETDKDTKTLATELTFLVKLDEGIFYTGTIDRVYETVDGKIRFQDHKTVSSISQYEEKSKMDRQISRYWWALKMIASGVGRIQKTIGDKEMWVSMPELAGKEIDGFDYNLIAKDFPKEPVVLKKGGLSKDKSQKTTYKLYRQKLFELHLDQEPYEEFLGFLISKPNQWVSRVDVKRAEQELESAIWEFFYTTGDMHDVKLAIATNPQALEALTYRNIGNHCQMCVFKTLCQTEIEGGNVSLVKNLGYKKREDVKK